MATLVSGINVSNGTLITPAILNAAPTLTTGTIIDADLSASAAIANSKLAGAPATAATANTIALRDGSGNLTANTFTGNLTGNVTGTVTSAATAASLTSPASNGLAKAYVAYNPTLARLNSVQFVPSAGKLVTATYTAHGLVTGDCVTLFSQTGNNNVLQGTWAITRIDADRFSFTITGTQAVSYTASNVYPIHIIGSYNVATVAPASTTSSGQHAVTFTTPFSVLDYVAFVTPGTSTGQTSWPVGRVDNPSLTGFTVRTVYYDTSAAGQGGDYSYTSVVVFGI
jgi:hypothetical protein